MRCSNQSGFLRRLFFAEPRHDWWWCLAEEPGRLSNLVICKRCSQVRDDGPWADWVKAHLHEDESLVLITEGDFSLKIVTPVRGY